MSIKTITPQELAKAHDADAGAVLIDVRTPLEFRTVHIGFAQNIPLDQLSAAAVAQAADKSKPFYVICHAGGRSAKACEQIAAWGFENAFSVEGGTSAWKAAGLPVVRDTKVISLERQVRIATGLLVMTGGLLALTVHVGLVWLAILVGGGLVFAGVTDTCAMGMMLARMPWNKQGVDTTACPLSK